MHHVAVAGHDVEVGAPAVGSGQTHDAPVAGADPLHRAVQAQRPPQVLEETHESGDHLSRASFREEDAPVALELVDEGVDGRAGEGVSPDQERVEAEHLAQVGVLDEAGHHVVDATVGLQPHQLGGHTDHAPEVEEGHVGQLHVPLLEDLLHVAQEAVVALHVAGALAGDLLVDELEVVGVVEAVPVFPMEAIERVHRQQLHVVVHGPARGLEQLLEAFGSGDDGRSSVEGEPLVLVDVGAPTRAVALLHEGGLDTGGLESDRQRQPTEPAADHRCRLAPGRHVSSPLPLRDRPLDGSRRPP